MFKVGTICIGQNFITEHSKRLNDMECVITKPLSENTRAWVWIDGMKVRIGTTISYTVRWADGRKFRCQPQYLRKKPDRGIPDSILNLFKEPVKEPACPTTK